MRVYFVGDKRIRTTVVASNDSRRDFIEQMAQNTPPHTSIEEPLIVAVTLELCAATERHSKKNNTPTLKYFPVKSGANFDYIGPHSSPTSEHGETNLFLEKSNAGRT